MIARERKCGTGGRQGGFREFQTEMSSLYTSIWIRVSQNYQTWFYFSSNRDKWMDVSEWLPIKMFQMSLMVWFSNSLYLNE